MKQQCEVCSSKVEGSLEIPIDDKQSSTVYLACCNVLKNSMVRMVKTVGLGLGLAASFSFSSVSHAQDPTFPNAPFVPEDGLVLLGAGQTEGGLISYQASFGDPGAATIYLTPTDLTGIERGDPDGVGISDLRATIARFPNTVIFAGWFFAFDLDYDLALATSANNVPQAPFDFDTSFDQNSSPLPCLTGRFVNNQFGQPVCGAEILQNIQLTVAALKATNVPVFLRIGYEAEGPWNGYDPEFYKELWRIAVGEIRRQEADNIATVWQVAAACFPVGEDFVYNDAAELGIRSNTQSREKYGLSNDVNVAFDQWYPDDNLVDWTGFSYFSQPDDCRNGIADLQRVVDYLNTKGKPVLLSETAPRGMHFGNNTYTTDPNQINSFFQSQQFADARDISDTVFEDNGLPTRTPGARTLDSVTDQEMFDLWFPDFISFLETNRSTVRGIAYINDLWEDLPRWNCDPSQIRTSLFAPVRNCSDGYWGDTQLGNNAFIEQQWREQFVNNPAYLSGTPGLFTRLQGFCDRVPENPQCSGASGQEIDNQLRADQTAQQASQQTAAQNDAAGAVANQTQQQAADQAASQNQAATEAANQQAVAAPAPAPAPAASPAPAAPAPAAPTPVAGSANAPTPEAIDAANAEEQRACVTEFNQAECDAARAETERLRGLLP